MNMSEEEQAASGFPMRVNDMAEDNRDPSTTWIWIDHGERYFEVFPWDLVQNAILNAHVDVSDDLLFQAGNMQGALEEKLWDLFDGAITSRMRAYHPEHFAELQKAIEENRDPNEPAQLAWNECSSYIIGAAYFHFARCAFDDEYQKHYQPWRTK